jgi:PAS domain S-box-containing protein
MVAASREVIIGMDVAGTIVVWNEGARDFYGYTREEVIGKPISVLLPPGEDPEFQQVFDRLLDGEPVARYETGHQRRDGHLVHVSISVSPVRNGPDGTIVGLSAIVRDMSEVRRTQDALEQAIHNERVMVEKLRDLDRVRTSFVSSVSHELRTPLTSILGYLELLGDDPADMNEHQVEMLDIVSRNSKRLLALIEDLLVLSRIESGSFKVLKEPVDIRALVSAVAREVQPKIAASGHHLQVQVADDVGSVLGDPSELERVMLGLLSNAIKFTQPGGVITIRAQREGGTARIAVIDTGLGIPEAELGEVFDPFFRSEIADRRAIPGTGLGLPIARTIVEQHGGSISCESEPGKGTAMTVTLPFAIQEQRPATRRVS